MDRQNPSFQAICSSGPFCPVGPVHIPYTQDRGDLPVVNELETETGRTGQLDQRGRLAILGPFCPENEGSSALLVNQQRQGGEITRLAGSLRASGAPLGRCDDSRAAQVEKLGSARFQCATGFCIRECASCGSSGSSAKTSIVSSASGFSAPLNRQTNSQEVSG